MTAETVAILTQPELVLLNQNATAPPRPLITNSSKLTYQGLGFGLAACNATDVKQRWHASVVGSSDGGGGDSGSGAAGAAGVAVNLHKDYVKAGKRQQVCMRLEVFANKGGCTNMDLSSIDLMDCGINHCSKKSILWSLPSPSAPPGTITSALTGHCLTADPKGKIAVAACGGGAGAGASGQRWKAAPWAGGGQAGDVSLTDATSGRCLTETAPVAPTAVATVWAGEAGGKQYVETFF